jgi:hypothetical protein
MFNYLNLMLQYLNTTAVNRGSPSAATKVHSSPRGQDNTRPHKERAVNGSPRHDRRLSSHHHLITAHNQATPTLPNPLNCAEETS